MLNKNLVKVGATSLVVAGLAASTLVLANPAAADIAPSGADATAVGSDTVQYVVDFLADGDPNGNSGYNAGLTNRLFTFDATGDANGRASYQNGTSTTLSSTIVLRQGAKPQPRPNGSGAGISALLADTNHYISFVRSSRLPNANEINSTSAQAFGGLHVYQIATDGLQIAVRAAGTNAPASLSATDLVNIYNGTYKKWGQVPGYTGSAPNDGIVPVIPQTGSGTRNDFLADLAAKNGNVAVTLASNVRTAEEHDPTGVTGVASGTDVNGNPVSAADAISPFSTGRDRLIDTGYFGTSPAPNTINLLPGATDGSTTATTPYGLARKLYIVARQSDVTATNAPFQPGGAQNYARSLFAGGTSWFARSTNAALFTSAGVTQAYSDLGVQ